MFSAELKEITSYVLGLLPVFQNGFPDVVIQEETGALIANTPTGWMPVFPADDIGNYFYLRNDRTARSTAGFAISDCETPLRLTANVFLVAIVECANPEILLAHLLQVLSGIDGVGVTDLNWNSDAIIAAELDEAEQEVIADALQRAADRVLVRVAFTLAKSHFTNQCLPPLC
ncbi:MAG: hypothetical protein EOP52_13435 [Sphingobacteriales bacterium]|nr:MAG: hypothetical protein EOP52_13435 [Sphingobacteriales bacterium]